MLVVTRTATWPLRGPMDGFSSALPRKTLPELQRSYEVGLKLCFLVASVAVLVGVAVDDLMLRIVASSASTTCLALLLFSWRRRVGWLVPAYAWLVVVALLLLGLSDVALLEPDTETVHYLGFLIVIVANSVLVIALWVPSVTTKSLLETAGLGYSWQAPAHLTPRVPLHVMRSIVPLGVALAAVIAWRLDDWPSQFSDPRFIPGVCLIVTHGVLVWRAAARVGYRSPPGRFAASIVARVSTSCQVQRVVSPSRRESQVMTSREQLFDDDEVTPLTETEDNLDEPPTTVTASDPDPDNPFAVSSAAAGVVEMRLERLRLLGALGGGGYSAVERDGRIGDSGVYDLYASTESRESLGWQWMSVVGTLCLVLSQLLAGAVLLWGFGTGTDEFDSPPDDPLRQFILFLYAVLSWGGQLAIAASVPLVAPPLGTLDDPFVLPRRTVEAPLKVLVILPPGGFDLATFAIVWYQLVQRGHSVTLATTGTSVTPDPVSVMGYGPGVWACSPLTLAMIELGIDRSVFRQIQQLPDSCDGIDGVFLPGGTLAASAHMALDPKLQRILSEAWDKAIPIASCGHATLALATTHLHSHVPGSSFSSVDVPPHRAGTSRPLLSQCSVAVVTWQMELTQGCYGCCCWALEPEEFAHEAFRPQSTQLRDLAQTSRAWRQSSLWSCLGRCCRRLWRGVCVPLRPCWCGRNTDVLDAVRVAQLGSALREGGSVASRRPRASSSSHRGCTRVCWSWLRFWCCGCDCWRMCCDLDEGPGCCGCCDAERGEEEAERDPTARRGATSRMQREQACLQCLSAACCGWKSAQGVVSEAVGLSGRLLAGPSVGWVGERGSPWDDSSAFVVEDGSLLSSRWSGDAFLLGRRLLLLMEQTARLARSKSMAEPIS
jgi:putative intracellular protease/amidase